MPTRLAALVALAVLLAGCVAGDDSRSLSCPYPDEIACESMSSVYERTAGQGAQPMPAPAVSAAAPAAPVSGWPAVRSPRVLRVWLAPWQDSDGDLHGAQEIYMLLEKARWQNPESGARIQSAGSQR